LRPGEIWGLELDSIDFLRRTVSVERQLTCTRANGVHLARLKTRQSRRTIELPEVTSLALAAHLEAFPPAPVEILDLSGKRPETRQARLLFTTGTGRPPSPSMQWKLWQAALRAAGIDKKLTLHGLRHYFATLLIHAGKDVKTVQMALGHSKPSITLDIYLHQWPTTDDRTRGIVDEAFGKRPVAGVDAVTAAE
jgi:integrase